MAAVFGRPAQAPESVEISVKPQRLGFRHGFAHVIHARVSSDLMTFSPRPLNRAILVIIGVWGNRNVLSGPCRKPPCSGQSRPSPNGVRDDAASLDRLRAAAARMLAAQVEQESTLKRDEKPGSNDEVAPLQFTR